MAGLFEVRIRVIQSIGNRETEAKAQYLAESAAELAGFWAATHGVGRNTADEANTPAGIAAMNAFLAPLFGAATDLGIANCADMDGDPTNTAVQPCVGVEVVNRPTGAAQKVSFNGENPPSHFSAPIKGTGDASGDDVDCSGAPADADDSCNWNRLTVGQTVEIPLYYEDSAGGITKLDFSAVSTEEFRLRVRTPACAGVAAGCDNGRLILYPSVTAPDGGENSDYRDPEKDPVLVQWSIFDGGGSGVITAWDEKLDEKRRMTDSTKRNTEISSGRINLARPGVSRPEESDPLDNFIVLQYLNSFAEADKDKHLGKKSDKQSQSIGQFIAQPNIAKPTLRLSLVGQSQRNIAQDNDTFFYEDGDINDSKFDIPFLEYQLLTKNSPPADMKSLIIGWAEIGGFRKEFRKNKKLQTTVSGFAIESF